MHKCTALISRDLNQLHTAHEQVLMATNRIDILDPALLRPGRIDRKIEFPNPNESSRADILRIHSRKMNLVRGIDLRKIADKMTGASGAELKACLIPCRGSMYRQALIESGSFIITSLIVPCSNAAYHAGRGRKHASVYWHNHYGHFCMCKSACEERVWCKHTSSDDNMCLWAQACCTEAGMFALRERRVHVTQVT